MKLVTGEADDIIEEIDGEPLVFYSDDLKHNIFDNLHFENHILGLGYLGEELYLILRSDISYDTNKFAVHRIY